MTEEKNPNFLTEEDLEKIVESGKLTRVENAKPIVPGAPPEGFDPYLSASIPPQLQLAPDLLKTDFGNRIPSHRLMPVAPAGLAGQNSMGQNAAAPATQTANAAQKTATTANSTANAASQTAATASTGVTTINAKTAVGIVSGTLQQIPIHTLTTSTLTPNLDNLNDGSTFGRVVNTALTTNKIDLSLSGFLNKNQDNVADGVTYARVVATALTSNQIDSTKAGFISTYGSVPSTIVGTGASVFSYTSTSTTASISWSSFDLLFSDGTTVAISSGSQSVTGLTAGTYYYYPYVAAGGTTVSFVTGGSGSPTILFAPQNATAAQAQNAQNVTALSIGSVTIVVMTGGSGSGGGSGRCCRSDTIVLSRERGEVPISSVTIGEEIMGWHDWTKVVEHKVVPHPTFVRVTVTGNDQTESLQITSNHHITTADRPSVPASRLSLSDLLVMKDGYGVIETIELIQDETASKCVLTCEPTHEFLAGEKHPLVLASNNVPVS